MRRKFNSGANEAKLDAHIMGHPTPPLTHPLPPESPVSRATRLPGNPAHKVPPKDAEDAGGHYHNELAGSSCQRTLPTPGH